MNKNKIELLAPAGDLEKLKISITYGADAVYMGGKNLGLRAKSKNFDTQSMKEGIDFAHKYNKKVYITANIYAENDDFIDMENYFLELQNMGVDGIIISDPGIFSVARQVVPNMDIHISTQANNTNYRSVMFWKNLGASRVVLARELSLKDINTIKNHVGENFELEAFVHGANCIAYSGRCLLSNYMAHRNSNKGECAQPCRWKYNLVEEKRTGEYMPVYEDERGTYIFNSKDLCLVQHIPDLINAGVTSFKIEGRMKTAYYVGAVTKIYREALDDYFESPEKYNEKLDYYFEELKKTSHRDFTTGFYYNKVTNNDQNYGTNSYIRTHDFVAIVESYDSKGGYANIEQRNKFVVGDEVEIFKIKGENFKQVIKEMYDEKGNIITEAPHPKQKIRLKLDKAVSQYDMIRKAMN